LQDDIHKIGGFTGDEVVGELSDEQMDRLVEAIQRTEGWKEGTVTEEP
jgi:ribosomal protein S13